MKKYLVVVTAAIMMLGLAACTAAAVEPDLVQDLQQSRTCTEAYCDDRSCDGWHCDDRISINRHGNVWDCSGRHCDKRCGN